MMEALMARPETTKMENKIQRAPKDQVIAFKADAQLASLLAGVKNKSELIRDAVYAFLGHLCPLCEGKGTIPHNSLARDWPAAEPA